MPGRDPARLTPKAIDNRGLRKYKDACDEVVSLHEDEGSSMLTKEELELIQNSDSTEYKSILEGTLKENLALLLNRLRNEIQDIPARHIPPAIKIMHESLMKVQGEATQRIEVTRKEPNHEEFIKILDNLDSDVVDGEIDE